MANSARVTQSVIELIAGQPALGRVTQSVIEFVVGGPLPAVTCGNPPSGVVSIPYSHTFPASGGTPPYTFAISAGSLPPGLSLNASTGVVSGTPTTAGIYPFTISITDTTPRTTFASCSITILAPGSSAQAGTTGARFKLCMDKNHEFLAAQLATKVREERQKKTDWPYRQLFPIPPSLNVQVFDAIPSPLPNVSTLILEYQVPSGFRFYLDAILQDFEGSVILPGDAIWTVDQNASLLSSVQASRVQGLESVPVPLGSLLTGRYWPFEQPYDFAPLTVLRSKVVNVNLGTGAPNYFVSGFFGFLVPTLEG